MGRDIFSLEEEKINVHTHTQSNVKSQKNKRDLSQVRNFHEPMIGLS